MRWTKEPPHLNPHLGCLNCGGGEMRVADEEITAAMDTIIYSDWGGWTITRDGDCFYQAAAAKRERRLSHFEAIADRNPDHDWRANYHGPLRDAIYQRQGKDRWVLVASGTGWVE